MGERERANLENQAGMSKCDNRSQKPSTKRKYSSIVITQGVDNDCMLVNKATYTKTFPTKKKAEDWAADLVTDKYERARGEGLYGSMDHIKQEDYESLYCYIKRLKEADGAASYNPMGAHISFSGHFMWNVEKGTTVALH